MPQVTSMELEEKRNAAVTAVQVYRDALKAYLRRTDLVKAERYDCEFYKGTTEASLAAFMLDPREE